jgi:putative transposase
MSSRITGKDGWGRSEEVPERIELHTNSYRMSSSNWEGRLPSRPAKKNTNFGYLAGSIRTGVTASSQIKHGDLAVAAPSQDAPRFVDQLEEVREHENRLPHWQQDGRTYVVTFHLVDSIPRTKLTQWMAERAGWLTWNPPPWSTKQEREYIRRFGNTVERWLDAGEGSCLLRNPRFAQVVAQAVNYFHGIRYCQHAWVVMPNHVHLLFSVSSGQQLDDLLRNWKGLTSRRINRVSNRSGSLWQKDYFDRLIRNEEHFWNCARYIRNNPVKARLAHDAFLLYESDFVRQALNWEGRLPSRPAQGNKADLGGSAAAAPSQGSRGVHP